MCLADDCRQLQWGDVGVELCIIFCQVVHYSASGARRSRFDSICNPLEFEHLIFDGCFGTYLKLAQGY